MIHPPLVRVRASISNPIYTDHDDNLINRETDYFCENRNLLFIQKALDVD